MKARIIKSTFTSMQVSVPAGLADANVEGWANTINAPGYGRRWGIVRKGDPRLMGAGEREPTPGRPGFVNIILADNNVDHLQHG